MSEDYLLLKWGTIKGWEFETTECESFKLLEKYMDNMSGGCAQHKPNKEQNELLCTLIEDFDGEIWNDWDDKIMSKEEAKEYVSTYGD